MTPPRTLPVIDVGPLTGPLVPACLDALTRAGQAVLAGIALSLDLDAGYFAVTTADLSPATIPTIRSARWRGTPSSSRVAPR
jgi:hypothetical protein